MGATPLTATSDASRVLMRVQGRSARFTKAVRGHFTPVAAMGGESEKVLAVVAAGDAHFRARVAETRSVTAPRVPLVLVGPGARTQIETLGAANVHSVGGSTPPRDLVLLLLAMDSDVARQNGPLGAALARSAIEWRLTPMEMIRFCSMLAEDAAPFAERYSLSAATVKTHTRSVLVKSGLQSTLALCRYVLGVAFAIG